MVVREAVNGRFRVRGARSKRYAPLDHKGISTVTAIGMPRSTNPTSLVFTRGKCHREEENPQ
jgi:hypothetical protein